MVFRASSPVSPTGLTRSSRRNSVGAVLAGHRRFARWMTVIAATTVGALLTAFLSSTPITQPFLGFSQTHLAERHLSSEEHLARATSELGELEIMLGRQLARRDAAVPHAQDTVDAATGGKNDARLPGPHWRGRAVAECARGAAYAIVWQCSDQTAAIDLASADSLDEIAHSHAMERLCFHNTSRSGGSSNEREHETNVRSQRGQTASAMEQEPISNESHSSLTPGLSRISSLFTLRLDCAYASNYNRMFDSTGWVDTAFVVSVDATRTGSVYPIGTHVGFINLMQSVREHSKAAVLAFSTGKPGQRSPLLPRDAETEFTQLVHFYIEDEMPVNNGGTLGPSFAMVRMALAAHARTAMVIPPRVIVGKRVDELLARANVHASVGYPYPMLPKFNMAHNFPTITAAALPFLAKIYGVASEDGTLFSNDDWLSAPWAARQLRKEWCVWAFSLGQEPHKKARTGSMCDCVLEYTHPAHLPSRVLDDKDRARLWRNAGCTRADAWLGIDSNWYDNIETFALQHPGCIV